MSAKYGAALLITDGFLRQRDVSEPRIARGIVNLTRAIDRLDGVFGVRTNILLSSEIEASEEFGESYARLEHMLSDDDMRAEAIRTIPHNVRDEPEAVEYLVRKFACMDVLAGSEYGFAAKIGVPCETAGDNLASKCGVPLEFAYLPQAYALGTKVDERVLPYLPRSRGKTGQRILLSDPRAKVIRVIEMSNDTALNTLAEIALESARQLGNDELSLNDVKQKTLRRKRKIVAGLVARNIVEPYNAS